MKQPLFHKKVSGGSVFWAVAQLNRKKIPCQHPKIFPSSPSPPSKLPRARHLRLVLFQTQQPLTTLGCHIHTARSQATSSHLSTIKKSKLTSLPEDSWGKTGPVGGVVKTYQHIKKSWKFVGHLYTKKLIASRNWSFVGSQIWDS